MILLSLEKTLKSRGTYFNIDIHISTSSDTLFLWGHSGAGKTTILNMIAGISVPDRGRIQIDDDIWFDAETHTNLPIQKRSIGYLFQDHRLFTNMTVEQNVAYPMRQKDSGYINFLLDVTGLSRFRSSDVSKLSGGQKQRVALARAFARKPALVLLDEPFSSLDFPRRQALIEIYQSLRHDFGFKSIIVTHTIREAILMNGAIAEISDGRVTAQKDPPLKAVSVVPDCRLLKAIDLVRR
jgi:molybdate transport system ATP-binding protein